MSRHKRVPDKDHERDESQDLRGLGLWPLVWLTAIVIAIHVVVLEDPARGTETVALFTRAVPDEGNASDPRGDGPRVRL